VPEKILQGIPASGGIAIGPAFLYRPTGVASTRRTLRADEVEEETNRYLDALALTRQQIKEIEDKVQKELGDEHAAIFQAHQLVLDDPLFIEEIPKAIETRRLNAEFLLSEGWADSRPSWPNWRTPISASAEGTWRTWATAS
jgi:phosphotransferase system enzyme I (PtsI)